MIRHEETAQDAGKFFIVGLPGLELDSHDIYFLEKFKPGGVILFERNISSPVQISILCGELASLLPEVLICVDQEGGRVARLPEPFTKFPPMRALGNSGSATLAERLGRAIASELIAAGINFDLAPVLDLATNPENTVIGDRSMGDDPRLVAELGASFIKGMQEAGVMACAKHFPGHGDCETDSHEELPVLRHNLEFLQNRELIPFKEAVAAGVGAMMTAHLHLVALDLEYPASLSELIMALLRESLNFKGLIVTDDMEMKAVSDNYTVEEASLKAVEAGADMVLICHSRDIMLAAREALEKALYDRKISSKTAKRSYKTILKAQKRFARPPESPEAKVIGCEEHLALANELATYLD
jgi:beta-N-acetylhexosaminidase